MFKKLLLKMEPKVKKETKANAVSLERKVKKVNVETVVKQGQRDVTEKLQKSQLLVEQTAVVLILHLLFLVKNL